MDVSDMGDFEFSPDVWEVVANATWNFGSRSAVRVLGMGPDMVWQYMLTYASGVEKAKPALAEALRVDAKRLRAHIVAKEPVEIVRSPNHDKN